MYFYDLYGYEHCVTLTHNDKLTKEEFKEMCENEFYRDTLKCFKACDKEDKGKSCLCDCDPDIDNIDELYFDRKKWLIKRKGFKQVKCQAGYFED